mmetsp:Transcript_18184/g.27436  ORF Transcript_18184/g.27436 Transcript_18184/m.27436 type:complete len:541 (-) Transcript_18184:34-1656(-)
MWTETSELRERWRSGSYDFEAGGESSSLSPRLLEASPKLEKGHPPRRNSGTTYRSPRAKRVAVGTALAALCLIGVVVFLRPPSTEYVSRAAHEARCEELRSELGSATARTQSIVRMRREGRTLSGESSNAVVNNKPLKRVSSSSADAMSALYSDWTIRILADRVDRARREEKRQRQLSSSTHKEEEELCDSIPVRESAAEGKVILRAVSLNLWQPAADSWPQRRKAMAQLLVDADVDLIACQEVRGGQKSIHNKDQNWAHDLAQELPGMNHVEYVPGTGIADTKGGRAPNGWTEEGVAIISRFPLSDLRAVGMPPSGRSSDRNPRTTLALTVQIPTGKHSTIALRVIASHLSYDRTQQCDAVRDTLKPWLDDLLMDDHSSRDVSNQLLLGDLNVYPDFEWPADILSKSQNLLDALGGPCWSNRPPKQNQQKNDFPVFVDVWEHYSGRGDSISPDSKTTSIQTSVQHFNSYNLDGWTFPNPETLNLDAARPDRVLLRAHPLARHRLRPATVSILGCNTVIKANEETTRPSDHRILLTDFVF